MTTALITYRERPGWPESVWGWKQGTRAEIRESAERLLADLRAEGLKRPAVFVDGRRIGSHLAASRSARSARSRAVGARAASGEAASRASTTGAEPGALLGSRKGETCRTIERDHRTGQLALPLPTSPAT